MKVKSLESLSKEELEKRLMELRKDLIKVNAQVAVGTTPKNPLQIKNNKKTIARILTLLEKRRKSNE